LESVVKGVKTLSSNRYYAPIKETFFRKLFIFVLIPILKSLAKIKVNEIENLPKNGAVIIACNHLSFFDGFALQYAIPRPIYFMGKAENFNNPFLRFFMYQIGAFPVKRGTYDRSALDQAIRILKQGQVLGMFPEGTRTYGKGLLPAKGGTAILAIKMNCPIIPIAMDGTHHILKNIFKKAQVIITVCPPVFPDGKMTPAELTEKYMRVMANNLPSELKGEYM
jgi:1-acyl-sn-glycerol-3-phosphate acyltransferase